MDQFGKLPFYACDVHGCHGFSRSKVNLLVHKVKVHGLSDADYRIQEKKEVEKVSIQLSIKIILIVSSFYFIH